jgi:hypothetical protein
MRPEALRETEVIVRFNPWSSGSYHSAAANAPSGRSTGSKMAASIVNQQIADSIRLATAWPDYPFLAGAKWTFKGLSHPVVDQDLEFNSFRFESETDPVVTVVVDITDSYLFENDD